MNIINVTVTGGANSGKTAIATLIETALKEHNIECVLFDQDDDYPVFQEALMRANIVDNVSITTDFLHRGKS